MICKDCKSDFKLAPKKPGYINVCPECTEEDVLPFRAEQGDEDGVVLTYTNNPFARGYLSQCGHVSKVD